MPHRRAAVSGGQSRAADRRAHDAAAAAAVGDRPEAGGVRRRHRQGHGQEAGEAVSDGGRVGGGGAARAECAGAHDAARGRHAARRAAAGARRRVSRRALAVAGVVVLVAALGTFGVWQWRGGSGRDDARPAGVAESSSTEPPRRAPGAVPIDRGDGARGHPGDGPVGDRGQCALCANRIQELPTARSWASTST